MKTLFAKTLLWFASAVIVTMLSVLIAAALNLNSSPGENRRPAPLAMLLHIQFSEARTAYETGGKQALANTLARLGSITGAESVMTDETGRDLLTGEDCGELLKGGGGLSRIPLFHSSRAAFARRSSDGKYWFVLLLQRDAWFSWLARPSHLLIALALIIPLCYAFARHLTQPVRQLQKAVERFGAGDLNARVHSNRRDELGELARTFDQMADRTQTLLSAERRLLLDISHELRSPLARLGVAVELARSGDASDAYLTRIQKEADRLNALVGELLQVTRAEGDISTLNLAPVRLDKLVAEIAEDTALEAEARGSQIRIVESQPVEIAGDPELLRRAIENVVRNAVRYAPQGTQVELRLTGGLLSVRDFGTGVPEDALPRIFDAFYRVDSDRNRNSGGVGLGLSIARRAVLLHQGTIQARNTNPGLQVEINLPGAILAEATSSLVGARTDHPQDPG